MSTDSPAASATEEFESLRPGLLRTAYRMLGSLADAEDIVQDASIRWMDADRASVRQPEAYLRQMVIRLSLDVLKSARNRRETYIGPWLPEPIVEPEDAEVEDVTLPLMLALERLSPLERAAFLLHDVFGSSFEEIAETIGRDAATCRQLASRARSHVRIDRPRYPVQRPQGQRIAEAFFAASHTGNLAQLETLLADDVVLHADGGGKRPAAAIPITGRPSVTKFLARLARLWAAQDGRSRLQRYAVINGLPGYVTRESDGLLQTTALQIENDRIVAIYVMRNPDKLGRLDGGPMH